MRVYVDNVNVYNLLWTYSTTGGFYFDSYVPDLLSAGPGYVVSEVYFLPVAIGAAGATGPAGSAGAVGATGATVLLG